MWGRLLDWLRPPKPLSLGERGELAAARFLRRLGYHIVAHRERDRMGEIDLVAVDDRVLVFVEVKTRRSADKGRPSEAVDEEKQQRLTRSALSFLKHHHLTGHPVRFDIVAVTWPDGARAPVIEHFPSAFEAALPEA